MVDLRGRENRLLDLSRVRDNRFKGMAIRVSDNNWARCTSEFCEWIIHANTAHGGTSPFPYGLHFLQGNAADIQGFPAELAGVPFLEVIPCDRADRRAAKLVWNEAGTESGFSFVALALILGIDPPKGTALGIDAVPLKDINGKPVAVLPLGDRIKRKAVQEDTGSKSGDAQK